MREFQRVAKLCEADGHMQQKLKQLLKLSKEKWDAACEHAKTAVQVMLSGLKYYFCLLLLTPPTPPFLPLPPPPPQILCVLDAKAVSVGPYSKLVLHRKQRSTKQSRTEATGEHAFATAVELCTHVILGACHPSCSET